VTRYRCVDARKAEDFDVTAACGAAGVSTSAYYEWAGGRTHESRRGERDDAEVLAAIREIHADSDGTYGQPRVTPELRRRYGWQVNHKRVERLMAEHGLAGHRPRTRRCLTKTDESGPPIPDLVGRLFDPDEVDRVWCGDLSYIPTAQGWLYLATVIDLASRRLLGWSMGDRPDAQLMIDALESAVAARGRRRMDEVVFHSDRGTQYTSTAFRGACERLGVIQSMGRTGSCLDNAVAESFFATLKVELVNRARYRNRLEARTAIFEWIHRYNARRLHSTLGFIPPLEWEHRHTLTDPVPSPMAA
jgi:putative transposase